MTFNGNFSNIKNVEVVYGDRNGIEAWRARKLDTECPDEWPYGLNRLRASFPIVAPVDLGPVPPREVIRAFVRGGIRNSHMEAADVSIAWDEGAAIRVFHHRPAKLNITGLIWATDDAVRRDNLMRTKLLRWHLRRFDRIWCLSQAQAKPTADWLGIDESRVEYVAFGVDTEFFSPIEYPDGPPLIVSFGNDRDRDVDTLFDALALVTEADKSVRAIVQASTQRTPPRGVTLIDKVPHRKVHELYGRASLAMVATRQNLHASGMTVALEAMATGRPVVITDTPGMDDYVPNGISGYRVPIGDSDAMAHAAQSILTCREKAAEMGRNGRIQTETRFNTTAMTNRIAKVVIDAEASRAY